MASVILRSAGAAAGNALLPGLGGAFIGSVAGGLGNGLDNKLGLGGHVTGPRLQNLAVQDSRYGAGIPIVYGRARVAGNVIWASDLIETQHDSNLVGGKGGAIGSSASSTTYTYSVHCAVGIALGAVGGINTIWADSKIIYQNGIWTSGVVDGAAIYLGTAAQNPDPFMQSILGASNVPAYRGLAYVVLENLQLGDFGNRLPNLTFEIAPSAANNNPLILGSVDAGVSQRAQTVNSGGMMPIVIARSSSEVQTVLVGGYVPNGSTCSLGVAEYDVTDIKPVEVARTQSASFSAANPVDSSWAMAPDGRFVAMYVQNSTVNTHNFVIYDSKARQFGSITTLNLVNTSSSTKQIAWIDAQHFVIDDSNGTRRGLRIFARAGLGIIDLGFYDVWGAGSATAYNNFYYAQFIAFAGGLLNLVWDISNPLALTLYARPLVWQNNALVVGGSYTLVSGLPLTSGSGPHGTIFPSGQGEYTLFYGHAQDFWLLSFVPTLTGATITRAWQKFTPSFGASLTSFPVSYGNRIALVQRGSFDDDYRMSEITVNSSNYSLNQDGVVVGGNALTNDFCAMALDATRLLLVGEAGFQHDITQLAIVQRCDSGDSLAHIVSDLLNRAGYAGADRDVSALSSVSVGGYVIQEPTTARAAIEPLQLFSTFDLVESGAQLRAVLRSASVAATVPSGEWRASNYGQEPPPALQITRAQELDLPSEISLDYIDAARDFEVNSQRARRITTRGQAVQKIALPVVCTASIAKQIAETRLYTIWAERELVRIMLSRRYLVLEPGDVINLGNGALLRIASVHHSGGLLQVDGFYVFAAVLNSTASADQGVAISPGSVAPLNTSLYVLDLPLLQSADDQPGVYVAASGLDGWTGASLWRASDSVNYSRIASLPIMATTGIVITLPLNVSCDYIDRASTLQVQLMNGTLSSCTELDLYNGANAALIGNEIIQFQTATLVAPGLYTLSNLLRGRRGTEYANASHAVGENFILLSTSSIEFVPALLNDRGNSYQFRALSRGQSLGDAPDNLFNYGLKTLQPLSPVNIQAVRVSGTGSDLTLTWKRRARLNAEWVANIDVPLDEPVELYDVEIMNGTTVIRTFSNVSSPTVTYTAAQQAADWGSVPANFNVNIYQISARVGRGRAASVLV